MKTLRTTILPVTLLFAFSAHSVLAGETDRQQSGYRQMKYTSRSKQEAMAWQKDIRAKLFDILKLDDLVAREQPIPFDTKVLSATDEGTYVQKEIEINSTSGRRVTIVLTLPQSKQETHPAVVCIHGHGGTRHIVYDQSSIYKGFASVLASRGCVTVSVDVGQHVVYESDRILMGERLWDLMRCVDYLESIPEVDRSRIGCAGLSLGGEMAMWLGAMAPRVSATVSSGFLTVMDQMEQNHCMCWKFDGLRELVEFADIYSLIAPRPLQCQNGLEENPKMFYVPIAREAMKEIKVIYSDFGQGNNAELDVHEGGHEIDLPGLLAFFVKHFSIPKG